MKLFQVTMSFKRPPQLVVNIKTSTKESAITIGKREAMNGGFGLPKKVKIHELQNENDYII